MEIVRSRLVLRLIRLLRLGVLLVLLLLSLSTLQSVLGNDLLIQSKSFGPAKNGFDAFIAHADFDVLDSAQPETQALLRTAIQRNEYVPLVSLGVIYADQREFSPEAEELLNQAIVVRGRGLANCPHQSLATMYYQMGDYRASLEHWRYLLRTTAPGDPENKRLRWKVGFLCYRIGEDLRAMTHFNELLKVVTDPHKRVVLQEIRASLALRQRADDHNG